MCQGTVDSHSREERDKEQRNRQYQDPGHKTSYRGNENGEGLGWRMTGLEFGKGGHSGEEVTMD